MEIKNYVWDTDKKTGKSLNKPIDKFNHLMDAWRYSIEKIAIKSGISKEKFKFIVERR